MSEDHICFCMLCFHVNHGFSREFHEDFVPHVDVIRSYAHDREHMMTFLSPYNRMGYYIYQLAHYMFAAGCRSDNVHHFTSSLASFQPRPGKPLPTSIAVISLLTLRLPTPHWAGAAFEGGKWDDRPRPRSSGLWVCQAIFFGKLEMLIHAPFKIFLQGQIP